MGVIQSSINQLFAQTAGIAAIGTHLYQNSPRGKASALNKEADANAKAAAALQSQELTGTPEEQRRQAAINKNEADRMYTSELESRRKAIAANPSASNISRLTQAVMSKQDNAIRTIPMDLGVEHSGEKVIQRAAQRGKFENLFDEIEKSRDKIQDILRSKRRGR